MTSERYRGSQLGLAVGDTLGTTLEFNSSGSFTPITDIAGGGPLRLVRGQCTEELNPSGHLHDDKICQSCAERSHGVVY